LSQDKVYTSLVYANFDVKTNPSKRKEVLEFFKGRWWVTVEQGKNGQNFAEYINNVYNHKFVICPEGNGIDTHRFWETLYMGSIPIVEKNINNSFYTGLKICWIDDWEEVNETLLNDCWNDIHEWEGNTDLLTFEYWKNKILNERN
jgi:hypothetical protein